MVLGRRTDAIAVPYAGAVSACASLPACDDMARRCEKAPASCACVGRDSRVTRLSHSCWRRSALAATALCMEAIVDASVWGVCWGVLLLPARKLCVSRGQKEEAGGLQAMPLCNSNNSNSRLQSVSACTGLTRCPTHTLTHACYSTVVTTLCA